MKNAKRVRSRYFRMLIARREAQFAQIKLAAWQSHFIVYGTLLEREMLRFFAVPPPMIAPQGDGKA